MRGLQKRRWLLLVAPVAVWCLLLHVTRATGSFHWLGLFLYWSLGLSGSGTRAASWPDLQLIDGAVARPRIGWPDFLIFAAAPAAVALVLIANGARWVARWIRK